MEDLVIESGKSSGTLIVSQRAFEVAQEDSVFAKDLARGFLLGREMNEGDCPDDIIVG